MKKIMLFAAACVALAACSKDIDTTTHEMGSGTAFEKGQTVTLTVNTGDQTKVSSELVTSGEDKDKVNFKWEIGDKIKVTVGTNSAEFTLSSGAGTATAEFTGTMPADGETFDVQYPVTDPDLATQTYSATEAIPHGKMKFTASSCPVGTPFTMNAANAALRLNFYADVTIGKIVVTDKTASPEVSYTLNCTGGVKNNTGNETMPFIIVLPAGSRNFEAKVYGTGDTPALICTRTTTSAQAFVNGEILNMPLKYDYPRTDMDKITIGGTVWAPVNCGYDATNYKYGKLYQWGRKNGCGYKATDITAKYNDTGNLLQTTASGPVSASSEDAAKFYKSSSTDWLTPQDGTRWNSGTEASPIKTIYDPCPDGWRVPTYAELNTLIDNAGMGGIGGDGWDINKNGYWFNGTTSPSVNFGLFLPAAGYRNYTDGDACDRGSGGFYWSSSVIDDDAWYLYFGSDSARMVSFGRANGFPVRCVQK